MSHLVEIRGRMTDCFGGRALAVRGGVLALAVVVLSACGSESSGSSPSASTNDTGIDGAGDVTGGPKTLYLQAYGGSSGRVAAQVRVFEPGAGPQSTCDAPVNADACQLTSCRFGGIGTVLPGHGNLGPMSASVGSTTVPLTYNGFGYPTVDFPSSITLGTGGTMTFHGGDGAGVPRFDISATIPGLAVIRSPVSTTEGGSALIDTSEDLSVTWAPISIGQVHFRLEGGTWPDGELQVSVTCNFEGASGAGVIPQTFLSTVKEMSGTSPTYAVLSSELEATTLADELTIVTQSFENSPSAGRTFDVTLQ